MRPHTTTLFPHTSTREQALEALKLVLEGIEGIKHVDRQAMGFDMIPDSKLPAILIVENSTNYAWRERHTRTARIEDAITLDVQLKVPRGQRLIGMPLSSYREALISRIIKELAENPTLTCQLSHEQEPTEHVQDILPENDFLQVQYIQEEPPYARAFMTLKPHYLAEVATAPDSGTTWTQIVLQRLDQTQDPAPYLETDPIVID